MFEHKSKPLAPTNIYYRRIAYSLLLGIVILLICLIIGVLGYHYLANIQWLDALHNSSMILSGMGPVVEIKTVDGKLFSSFYALFSGVVFITNIGIILAPVAHRLFHSLHVEEK